jgi:hypothetical protein
MNTFAKCTEAVLHNGPAKGERCGGNMFGGSRSDDVQRHARSCLTSVTSLFLVDASFVA